MPIKCTGWNGRRISKAYCNGFFHTLGNVSCDFQNSSCGYKIRSTFARFQWGFVPRLSFSNTGKVLRHLSHCTHISPFTNIQYILLKITTLCLRFLECFLFILCFNPTIIMSQCILFFKYCHWNQIDLLFSFGHSWLVFVELLGSDSEKNVPLPMTGSLYGSVLLYKALKIPVFS